MIFDLFATTNYTFLQLNSGSGGNAVVQEWEANGIVKLRDGMIQEDSTEAFESTSSVHVRPTEPFLAVLDGNLVGHGIRVNNAAGEPVTYRIEGQVEGKDFDLGTTEFFRVTLKRESIWQGSDLPLT